MTGFVKAMRQNAAPMEQALDVVDTCGTGGDGLSTFNISTAAAIVASAAGAKIAKHGNRSVSSKSGSADVLECLGIHIQSTPEETRRQIQEKNMGFLFAPLYHSSMKQVAAVRKQLGFRTVFNLLGPLCRNASQKANHRCLLKGKGKINGRSPCTVRARTCAVCLRRRWTG